jgi:hypothetical protein
MEKLVWLTSARVEFSTLKSQKQKKKFKLFTNLTLNPLFFFISVKDFEINNNLTNKI